MATAALLVLYWLTHFREERRREDQAREQKQADAARERAKDFAQTERPEATPAELRQIYERCRRRDNWRIGGRCGWRPISFDDSEWESENPLAELLCAHPHTPLDVVQEILGGPGEIAEAGVTGLLP